MFEVRQSLSHIMFAVGVRRGLLGSPAQRCVITSYSIHYTKLYDSAFARKVGLSESLIRKYLKGAEPGFAKANQIALRANCSLEWLATGCGYLYRRAEVVDREALAAADRLTAEHLGRMPQWQGEDLTVITSYSIHYTKLYEICCPSCRSSSC